MTRLLSSITLDKAIDFIGLIDLEVGIENTALMQISQWHTDNGDYVEWYSPLYRQYYKKIYCSSLFDFTDKSQVPKEAICGGTGFSIEKRLPKEIEDSNLDYSIYPYCNRSYLWFSRGCNYNHWFCVVPKKEGKIHAVAPKNLNPQGKEIVVMDNSYFDGPECKDGLKFLALHNQPVEFYGVRAQTFNEENALELNKLPKQFLLHCAWDNPQENVIPYLEKMAQRMPKRRIRVYYLTVGDSQADQYRSDELLKAGFDAFCMPYNKKDPYQRARTRWENFKAIRKSVPFEKYQCGEWKIWDEEGDDVSEDLSQLSLLELIG